MIGSLSIALDIYNNDKDALGGVFFKTFLLMKKRIKMKNNEIRNSGKKFLLTFCPF
jgi:hypothetical protein